MNTNFRNVAAMLVHAGMVSRCSLMRGRCNVPEIAKTAPYWSMAAPRGWCATRTHNSRITTLPGRWWKARRAGSVGPHVASNSMRDSVYSVSASMKVQEKSIVRRVHVQQEDRVCHRCCRESLRGCHLEKVTCQSNTHTTLPLEDSTSRMRCC